jgi:hypothetical protein
VTADEFEITHDASTRREPAPWVYCEIRNPNADASIPDLQAFLDTGADNLGLTREIVDRLALPERGIKPFGTFDGPDSRMRYYAELRIDNRGEWYETMAVVEELGRCVVGLRVLNHFTITLDGPSQSGKLTRA